MTAALTSGCPAFQQHVKRAEGVKGDTGAQGEKGDKGDKGDTGATGKDGKDGVTPLLLIGKDNIWRISYDNAATWTSLGVAATGPKGDKGDTGATGATAPSIYAQQGKCRNHAAFSTLKTIKHPL